MSLLIRLKPLFFKKKILFLIAHPDDEVMFFGPSILQLLKDNEIYLVCLSNGNADGIGKIREKELFKSCQILGIPGKNIEIIENSNLQDSMTSDWNPDLISEILTSIVIKKSIEIIITFDEFGISRHPNHIACYHGTLLFFNSLKTEKPHIYVLPTVFILRKYLSFFDLFFTLVLYLYHLLLGPYFFHLFQVKDKKLLHLFINSFSQFQNVQKAMIGHSSQMKWFRWLYIYTSRYMIFNELERRK
ncbi:hypothetical protein T552_04078 [Pneumocystis carinii B80]|uniref:N-acetylglucosaminylphosphatidylinositol deacetylase n=1 Tax=Pneumocystis carinii (strain B80) TaxID=1408658 RepID=A0A0W4ZP82_PNEC8|nr:hypothetical protein T552_04078 [Pneumocystis carinii B80]KTW30201.1 hypothetical protein T552_04078 [Pneumocystis carinii B80]